MVQALPEHVAYYASPGIMTNAGNHADLLKGLPGDLETLCRVVQGNMLHVFWAERYGVTLSDEQKSALQIRPLAQKLARLRLVDDRPVLAERAPEKRQVGNCRVFHRDAVRPAAPSGHPGAGALRFCRVLLARSLRGSLGVRGVVCRRAALGAGGRPAGQPAEAGARHPFQRAGCTRSQFISGGAAWQMCRLGQADPAKFGIMDMQGWWFIWGNVVRDFMALNKVEILPWDGGWGHLTTPLDAPPPTQDELPTYDQIAALTLAGAERFETLREAYKQDERWRLPQELLIGARVSSLFWCWSPSCAC